MRPRTPAVLAVSHARDLHTRHVLDLLRRQRVPALRLDTGAFPGRLRLAAALDADGWRARLSGGGAGPLDPAALRGVWYRRPRPYAVAAGAPRARWAAAFCACHAAAQALWASCRSARWVNAPSLQDSEDAKPAQLALAARLGLAVPRSLVTNDAAAARAFIAERPEGETIHKNVTSAPSLWRPTALARADDTRLLASLRELPLLFQERVPAVAEVRVTLVGGEAFAAEIAYPRGRPALDWRVDFRRARLRAVSLPSRLEARLHRLIQALGLCYGAIDLRRRPDGEHVFLEVNPSGEWLFVERATGLPITAALAALLARGG
ncbi:MAG TPA: alpha-L-glutamate ligase [Anaeromyxobacteraceae bacterium]|nr:alpha-L-glutamate ligase [Anaeromyxobacteraceae bacterium]